ncbi:molybdopterin cofactor-binding domain-containing protein [Candidatus Poriferisodalis sp.]|uniref:molybdopterin cofactor-binding domain-containing protein n=1 Tax=Candidatus Poriferisodalis sp. TaxID=3101277 RepID=UPI003C6F65D8
MRSTKTTSRPVPPTVVDGQARGGVAQGVGAQLSESQCRDEYADLMTVTHMGCLIPTAMEIPDIEIVRLVTLTDGENDAAGQVRER